MNKPDIPSVAPQFAAYYRKHPAWGHLHIVLDDHNVDDASVAYCLESAQSAGDTEAVTLATILAQMSKTQRKKLGHFVRRVSDA